MKNSWLPHFTVANLFIFSIHYCWILLFFREGYPRQFNLLEWRLISITVGINKLIASADEYGVSNRSDKERLSSIKDFFTAWILLYILIYIFIYILTLKWNKLSKESIMLLNVLGKAGIVDFIKLLNKYFLSLLESRRNWCT